MLASSLTISQFYVEDQPADPADRAPTDVVDADEDALLLMRCGQGDEDAFVALIEKWKNPLINYFYRSTRSLEESEDLAQITFVRVYRAADRYRPEAKFSTYLFQIARRLLINEHRRRTRKPLEAVDPSELHAVHSDAETRRMAEIEEAFEQAVAELPEKHATAILLFKQQEMSYEEIAETMDASVSAVKTWIFRARQHLRDALRDFAH